MRLVCTFGDHGDRCLTTKTTAVFTDFGSASDAPSPCLRDSFRFGERPAAYQRRDLLGNSCRSLVLTAATLTDSPIQTSM